MVGSVLAYGNNFLERVAVNSPIGSFGEFKEDTVNASVFGGNNPEAVRICDRAGWQ